MPKNVLKYLALQTEAESGRPGIKLTLEELLELRVECPPGTAPLTDEDIQRAIGQGAMVTFDKQFAREPGVELARNP